METVAILDRVGGGRMLDDLVEAVLSVATEVVATGKPGQVTLALKITTSEQGDPMVTITESISRKTPVRSARGGFLFAVDGELHREDPRAPRLPGFRQVEPRNPEVRQAIERTATIREVTSE